MYKNADISLTSKRKSRKKTLNFFIKKINQKKHQHNIICTPNGIKDPLKMDDTLRSSSEGPQLRISPCHAHSALTFSLSRAKMAQLWQKSESWVGSYRIQADQTPFRLGQGFSEISCLWTIQSILFSHLSFNWLTKQNLNRKLKNTCNISDLVVITLVAVILIAILITLEPSYTSTFKHGKEESFHKQRLI